MRTTSWWERITVGDAQELATDTGDVPMNVGALLLLDTEPAFDLDAAVALLADRLQSVPRLRQRLADAPWGCGRAIWVDDSAFDVRAHLERVACPAPGDREALLHLASLVVTRPLDRSRPLWRAVLVTGLAEGRTGLVVAFHHVLADGIGGLAVLSALVDGAQARGPVRPPAPRLGPTRGELFRDAVVERGRWLRALPRAAASLPAAAAELGRDRPASAPRCSLNTATGPRRRVAVVEADLTGIRGAAHAHGATVNDVLLTVVTGALRTLLLHRGERVPALVVSVPVSARTGTTTAELGNRTGVMPVRVPLAGPAGRRLERVARITAAQKTNDRGASGAVLAPAFRLLAGLGLFRWFIDRQRLVNTFLTNLRGPQRTLSLLGARISGIVPITITTGNVTVAFASFSYAGALSISVIVDPDAVPDAAVLTEALQAELDSLAEAHRRAQP